jgi:hypothetical protein
VLRGNQGTRKKLQYWEGITVLGGNCSWEGVTVLREFQCWIGITELGGNYSTGEGVPELGGSDIPRRWSTLEHNQCCWARL